MLKIRVEYSKEIASNKDFINFLLETSSLTNVAFIDNNTIIGDIKGREDIDSDTVYLKMFMLATMEHKPIKGTLLNSYLKEIHSLGLKEIFNL